jgi:small nuclear ribonucleoprotein (snRNP)-like protein
MEAGRYANETERIKARIERFAGRSHPRVKVAMKDKRTIRGTLIGVDEEAFTLVEKSSQRSVTLRYSDVEKVSGKLSGADIGKFVAVAALTIGALIGVLVLIASSAGGCC